MNSIKTVYPSLFNRLYTSYKQIRQQFGYNATDAIKSAKLSVNFKGLMEAFNDCKSSGFIS